MKNITKALYISITLIILLSINNCFYTSLMQFTEAEPLGKGKRELGFSASYLHNLDHCCPMDLYFEFIIT